MSPGKGFKPRTTSLRKSDGKARAEVRVYRPKKCAACADVFTPIKSMQKVCGPMCALRWVTQVNEKQRRVADRARLQEMQPLSYWVSKAQEAFNKYVRLRDIKAGHGCIDCGKPFEPDRPGGAVDAGHYLSRGSAPHLKFDERNVFAQRKNCNRPGGTTRDDFRAGVIARIGLAAVEALESDQSVKQYRAEDLKEIIAVYRQKVKELK
jgi:hypothetical protein